MNSQVEEPEKKNTCYKDNFTSCLALAISCSSLHICLTSSDFFAIPSDSKCLTSIPSELAQYESN
jgi:hypothetical protein